MFWTLYECHLFDHANFHEFHDTAKHSNVVVLFKVVWPMSDLWLTYVETLNVYKDCILIQRGMKPEAMWKSSRQTLDCGFCILEILSPSFLFFQCCNTSLLGADKKLRQTLWTYEWLRSKQVITRQKMHSTIQFLVLHTNTPGFVTGEHSK